MKTKKSKTWYWWKIYWNWFKIMDYEEVVVWSYLYNKFQTLKTNGELGIKQWTRKKKQPKRMDENWFYCTRQMMLEDLGITRQTQDRIIKKLKDKGYIKTRLFSIEGYKPTRHFRLARNRVASQIRRLI